MGREVEWCPDCGQPDWPWIGCACRPLDGPEIRMTSRGFVVDIEGVITQIIATLTIERK